MKSTSIQTDITKDTESDFLGARSSPVRPPLASPSIRVKVTVDTVPLVVRRVDKLKALGTDVAVALPQGSQLHHDGLLDGAGLQLWLGRGGEANGRVLQSDDLGLLDELLQVGPVLESVLAVQGEDLEDGHHVPGQIVLGCMNVIMSLL